MLAALEQANTRLEARGGVVRPYSPEWAANPDAGLLTQLAAATGGRVDSLAALTTLPTEAEPIRPPRAWWPFLVAAALLLWLIEVAVRRGWLRLRRK